MGCVSWGLASGVWGVEVRGLAFGVWSLKVGASHLAFGVWKLGFGILRLGCAVRVRAVGVFLK